MQSAERISQALRSGSDRLMRLVSSAEGRSVLWSLSDQLMVSGANFVIGIAVARLLGVEEFGQFTLILMLAAFAGVLADYVICAPMMTLAGRRRARSDSYFAAILVWGAVIGALLALAVTGVVAAIYGGRDGGVSWLMLMAALVSTAGLTVHSVVRRILFARRRFAEAFCVDGARFLAFIAATIATGYRFGAVSAEWVLILLGATAVLAAVPSIGALARARLRRRLVLRVWQRHWPAARWMVLMAVVAMGQEQIVWIVVSFGLGDAAVGGMRAGQHLLGVTHFIAMAKENFVPRTASAAYDAGGVDGLRQYLMRQTLLLGIPTFGLIVVICVPAALWLELLYGPDYVAYAPVLWVFGASYAVVFLRELWVYYLRTIERTRTMFTAFALSSAVALILIWPALSLFGVLGAAVVVLLAHLVSAAVIGIEILRHMRSHADQQPLTTGHVLAPDPA